MKYETLAGTRMVLDVPPLARRELGDPTRQLFITEGARKADAAVSKGLCCIVLLGVWSWRGTNEQGGKLALADWDSVALNERDVYIVFDSDVMEKPAVHAALARLQAFLTGRSAHKRLHERKLLASIDLARHKLTIRKTLEGTRRAGLHFRASILSPSVWAQEAQEGKS